MKAALHSTIGLSGRRGLLITAAIGLLAIISDKDMRDVNPDGRWSHHAPWDMLRQGLHRAQKPDKQQQLCRRAR
jgi:hypothetical protein